MSRNFRVYRVCKPFRRPHDLQTTTGRGTVVEWEKEMRLEDNRGLLFAENDLIVVSCSSLGIPVGQTQHYHTVGRHQFSEMEAPSNEQLRDLLSKGLIKPIN